MPPPRPARSRRGRGRLPSRRRRSCACVTSYNTWYGAPRVSERLYIVDGHGYIFRAHYGLMNVSRGERKEVRLSTAEGMPTGALYVFSRMLLRMEEDNQPKRMVVV